MKIVGIAAAGVCLALMASAAVADNITTGAGAGGGPTVTQGLTKTGPGTLASPSTVQSGGGNPQEAPIVTSRSNKKHGLATSGDQQAR